SDPVTLERIEAARAPFAAPHRWQAAPIGPACGGGNVRTIANPARPEEIVGEAKEATAADVAEAVGLALAAQPAWENRPVSGRADLLRAIADLYERNAAEFFALLAREAGKTLADAV